MSRKTLTYFDTGVVIAAFSSKNPALSDLALELISERGRMYVVSGMLRLELLPGALYVGDKRQVASLQGFFDDAAVYVPTDDSLIDEAIIEAAKVNGIGAADVMHIAAAKAAGATEFYTTENSTKPLYSVRGIDVIHFP